MTHIASPARLFFFQAEDGIRDGRVTGVQTCALPIWRRPADRPGPAKHLGPLHGRNSMSHFALPSFGRLPTGRSEERRVGKECRSRWAAYSYRKKKGRRRAGWLERLEYISKL